MIPRLLASVFLILPLISSSLLAQQDSEVLIPHADSLQQWMSEFSVPNLGIGIIDKGELVFSESISSGRGGVNSHEESIFDVASLTKSLTTHVTLSLASDGLLDLDDSLSDYWIDPDVSEDPRYELLTARHVLSHRSGFPNWRYSEPESRLSFQFEPGAQFQYSGEGFEYLRRALESKFGQSFVALTESLVFQPMDMDSTYLVWDDEIDLNSLAGAYNSSGEPYDYRRSIEANAADNLLTTVEDFGFFGIGVMNRIGISDEYFQMMVRPHSNVRANLDFGLGWIVLENLSNDEYALLNLGSDDGVNAAILLLPESGNGVVILTNSDSGRGLIMKLINETVNVGGEILGRL